MGSQAVQASLWGRNPAHWASIQEATSQKAYEYVLDQLQLQPADKLLDIGCGSGVFCSLAASYTKQLTGFDATPSLLDEARRRVPETIFVNGDMEALPFDDASFDVVTGFNSFQYAASIPGALTEAHRVLKHGGRLVAMIWGNKADCEAATYLAAIGSLLPPPPPGAPGPFALSEHNRLEELLAAAGFQLNGTIDYPTTWDYPDLATALDGLLSAGPATRAIDHAGYQKVHSAIAAAVQPYLQPNGHVIYHNKFRIVTAIK